MKIMGRLIMTKQFEILDRLEKSTLVVLTTKYISKDYLNHLHTVEKAINNFNFEPLDEKLTDKDEIDFHKPDTQDNKSTVEEKLVQQSKFFKYWNVAEKNEESDASINKNDEYVTANQFYFPEFANKLRNWYLPTCPLWSRLMTSIIKNKEAAAISKDIIVRNITEEINTNAQAEQCFRIKKYSSFKEKDVSICEFIKRNYEDNIALQRETVDACLHEISKRKKLTRKDQDKCLTKVCEKIMNGVSGPLYAQTGDEDSLRDTNKPKEDQEKCGLNRKVKKLKRLWSYLKESSQILEPSAKSRKISRKVRKK